MVLYKRSNRPDHDCMCNLSLRRAENANLVFHQRGSAAIILHDNMPESALDKVVTFAGDVLFEWKLPTSIKPEVTLGERIDLRISAKPEVPETQVEKEETHF